MSVYLSVCGCLLICLWVCRFVLCFSDCRPFSLSIQELFLFQIFIVFIWSTISFSDARATCNSRGSDLLSITSVAEKQYIANRLKPLASSLYTLWIGLNDRDANRRYFWSDFSPFVYTNWYRGNPTDTKGAFCNLSYSFQFVFTAESLKLQLQKLFSKFPIIFKEFPKISEVFQKFSKFSINLFEDLGRFLKESSKISDTFPELTMIRR